MNDDFDFFPTSLRNLRRTSIIPLDNSFLDTPDTIIARSHPLLELASLNIEARRDYKLAKTHERHAHKQIMEGLYNDGIQIGGGVAETYLSRLDSTQTARIKQIKVEPYVRSFTGRGRGMVITFRR